MECCKTYLGEFPHNEDIDTGLTLDESGEHTVTLETINETKLILKVTPADDATTFVIPKGSLNENLLYWMKIKKPSGDYFVTDDCENYTLKTFIAVDLNCGNLCE